ncbi:MAG TPA: hypothetical protein PKH10_04975 [bacterium]|nr:hypothetical protein [bacterium]
MKKASVLFCALLFIVSCGDESTGPQTDTNTVPDESAVTDDTVTDEAVVDEDAATGESDLPDESDLSDDAVDPSDQTIIPDDTTDGLLSDEETDGEVPDDTDPDCQPGAYPEVCGDWAQQMIFTATAKVAGFDAATAEIRTLFRMTQRQQGGHILVDSKICHIVIENKTALNPIKILMPQSFADALIMLHKEADIELDGTYYQAPYWELRSIKQSILPADPGTYELPTEPTDPDVEDWDNDSIPGLRVNVNAGLSNGVTHIVEKSSSELWGTVKGTGETQTIDGTVHWTDKQVVLSTDNVLFKGGAQNVIKEEGPNIWRQKCIPANWTCTEVMANGDTLFPPL